MPTTRQKSYTSWVVVAGIVLGASSLAYPRTLLDSPASTYIASVILGGGVPYRDAWDVRAPGIYFVYALQLLLFGKSAVALRAFDALWQLATAITLSAIGVRLYGRPAIGAIAAVAYLVAYYSHNFWNWAQPDTFLSLPLALAFLVLLRGLDRSRVVDWAMVGFLIGIAALLKLPYGLFGVLPLVAAVGKNRDDARRLLTSLTGLAGGFATALLSVLCYFWANGAMRDFLDAQFVFAPAYLARVHTAIGFRDFLISLRRPALLPVYAMAAVDLWGLLFRYRRQRRFRVDAALLVGWLAVALIALVLHGSYLGYHYLALVAPITLLFAKTLHDVFTEPHLRRGWAFRATVVAVATASLVPVWQIGAGVVTTRRVLAGFDTDAPWRELGRYIRERSAPGETIFVWGNVPIIYLYAERDAASRFLPTAFLSLDVPRAGYRKLLLAELKARKPVYLVLCREGSITPGLPDASAAWRAIPALGEMVDASYGLEAEIEYCELHRRKS